MVKFTELLKPTWKTFVAHKNVILIFAIILTILSLSPEIVQTYEYAMQGQDYIQIKYNPTENTGAPIFTIATIIVSSLVALVSALIYAVIIVYQYYNLVHKEKTLSQSLQIVVSKLGRLIPAFIIYFLAIALLYFALIIPGIIFSIYWVFYIHAILLRDKSILEAFGYSKKLITNNWWRTLGYSILVSLLVIIATLIPSLFTAGATLALVLTSTMTLIPMLIIQIINGLFSVAASYFTLTFMVVYFKALEKEKRIKVEKTK